MTIYEFPARGGKPPVKLTWYDGGLLPPKPVELGENEILNPTGGALLVGSKGKLMHDTYGRTRACCRTRCTSRTASRRRSCRVFRTRITR